MNFSSEESIKMGDWELMRFTLIGGNMLITEASNITVYTDTGEVVNHETEIVKAGTYIVKKLVAAKPANFKLVGYDTSIMLTISVEFVRPSK